MSRTRDDIQQETKYGIANQSTRKLPLFCVHQLQAGTVTVHGLMYLVFRCFTFYFVNFVVKFGSNLVKNIKNTAFFAIKTRERLPGTFVVGWRDTKRDLFRLS
jgi:hypothetical protein